MGCNERDIEIVLLSVTGVTNVTQYLCGVSIYTPQSLEWMDEVTSLWYTYSRYPS